MFDLKAWAAKPEDNNVLTYEIKGVSDTALLVKRSDKANTQQFTKATFQELLAKGRLTIVSATSFTVEKDTDWKPESNFTPLDLGA